MKKIHGTLGMLLLLLLPQPAFCRMRHRQIRL
jgi:hypothetical protein